MYRIGYIDDEWDQFDNIQKKLGRRCKDMELVLFANCKSKEEILDTIYKEQIDVLLVDYKMVSYFGFNGTTLINYINDCVRDLQCFILTAVDNTQIEDGIVADRDRFSKSIFDTEGGDKDKEENLQKFLDTLHESAVVFATRRSQKVDRYKILLEKKKAGEIGADEEEFIRLYKTLASYGLVETLPANMLNSEFEKKLDEILKLGKEVVAQHQGE